MAPKPHWRLNDLADPSSGHTHCSPLRSPVLHYLTVLAQILVHGVSMLSNHLILCRPLLLLASIFPSIRVFSNESALHIRCQSIGSFSFSISPSNEYSGLISFRSDRFDLLAVQGTLKSLPASQVKSIIFFGAQAYF